MDQSQTAATPTEPMTAAKLALILKKKPDRPLTPTEEANVRAAVSELSMIFELRDSTAFKWFMETLIDGPYRDARNMVLGEHSTPEEVATNRPIFMAFKKVKAGILNREIVHRERLDPRDSELPALRERLAAL